MTGQKNEGEKRNSVAERWQLLAAHKLQRVEFNGAMGRGIMYILLTPAAIDKAVRQLLSMRRELLERLYSLRTQPAPCSDMLRRPRVLVRVSRSM